MFRKKKPFQGVTNKVTKRNKKGYEKEHLRLLKGPQIIARYKSTM